MHVRLGSMLGSLVHACCGRDLARALFLLRLGSMPAPPVFWTLLVLLLESVDALAWACWPADLMGSVYSLVSVALSVAHSCVAEVHSMLWLWDFARCSAFAPTLVPPSEVPYPAVVGMSLALVLAPSEVPAYSDRVSVVRWACRVARFEPCSSAVSVVGVQCQDSNAC